MRRHDVPRERGKTNFNKLVFTDGDERGIHHRELSPRAQQRSTKGRDFRGPLLREEIHLGV